MSAFVLGFADEAAQIAGLAWSLAGSSGAVTVRNGEVRLLSGASDDGGRVAAGTEDDGIEGELPADGSLALTGDPTPPGSPSLATGEVEVRFESESTRCPAHLTRWESDPAAGADLIRHLVVPTDNDGGMIVLVATRPDGSTDHASEVTSSWLAGREGAAMFAESFLSTQYDGSGMPSRVGLELWPVDPDAHALRAAGTEAHGAVSSDDSPQVSSLVLHTSADGFRGVGSYLVVRA